MQRKSIDIEHKFDYNSYCKILPCKEGKIMNMKESIKKSRQGDKKATEDIIEYFMTRIGTLIKTTYIAGYEEEDLKQMSIITILKIINAVDLEKDMNLEGYIFNSVRNSLFSQRSKAIARGMTLSLNYKDEEESNGEIINLVRADTNIEEDFIKMEENIALRRALETLTKEEREFILMIFSKGHGGVTEYSKKNNINYIKCIRLRDRLLKKLGAALEQL